jgi:MFS family permease
MQPTSKSIVCVYLSLTLLNTLATSFIWGINTLFLLDAGLSNTQAFAANAFFTVGQVLFEVPTGIVADSKGRRLSFLLGSITLIFATLLYYLMWKISAPFWGWAIVSILLGLGFTFFSGATDAWLVDALTATHYTGTLDSVFAKGQIMIGIGMLGGSVAGGMIAQYSTLGVPYLLRSLILGIGFIAAFFFMFDIGFQPAAKEKSLFMEAKKMLTNAINNGFKNPPLRWLLLAEPFASGVGIYAFYAMQPYILNLYGHPKAYSIAGLVAALVAGAQIVGGFAVPYLGKLFKKRSSILLTGVILDVCLLFAMGIVSSFHFMIFLIILWALNFAMIIPVRQSFINGLIPSQQRATILSMDSLMGSSGGVVIQPLLGKAADVWNYPVSYFFSSLISLVSFPFILLIKREEVEADIIDQDSSSL